MNPLFENHWNSPTRRMVDRLPHEVRRSMYRILRPNFFRYLQFMRTPDPSGKGNRFSEFIRTKSLFVHIPKCAGNTVREAIYEGRGASHTTMHNYSIAFSAAEFRSFFKFVVVRHPFERLYSAYRFLYAGGKHSTDARVAKDYVRPFPTFERFVMDGLTEEAARHVIHLKPMHHFAEICPGWMPLDEVFDLDDLSNGLAKVAVRLGSSLGALPWENRTLGTRSDPRDAFSDEMREKASEFYRRDLELFGFSERQ